ncbi:hypothetical protein [Streptomyces sp. NPDC003032]
MHWTSRHQHTRALTAPFYTSSLAADIIAADTRWRLVHQLIHEPDIAVRDRAAGLLPLLFAQPPSRICALSLDDVLDDGTTLCLRRGTHPVEIPPPLDGLLRELVRHPVGKAHRVEPGPSRCPAFVLSRLLGFSEQTAPTGWQRAEATMPATPPTESGARPSIQQARGAHDTWTPQGHHDA